MVHAKGTLWISSSISAEQTEAIIANFSKMLKRQLIMEVVEKTSLLGGFIAYIDGKVYDASVRGKLNEFEKILL